MTNGTNSIKYSTLGLYLIIFILGGITIRVIQNYSGKEVMEFSTLELIGFVFSIILGSAGIVLSINAIQLGKMSEETLLKRNDDSIKMQSDIFHKTIEVLSRIESSTGVTEKRIEDIIAGRSGQLADKISKSKNIRNRYKLEDEIKTMLEEKPSKSTEELQKMMREEEERTRARYKYDKYHESLLESLSKEDGVEILKSSHGYYGGTGENLFDGLFKIKERKIGMSIFSDEEQLADIFLNGFKEFIGSVVEEISKGTIQDFFYVGPESVLSERLRTTLREIGPLFKDNLQSKVYIVTGSESEIIKSIIEKVEQNTQLESLPIPESNNTSA